MSSHSHWPPPSGWWSRATSREGSWRWWRTWWSPGRWSPWTTCTWSGTGCKGQDSSGLEKRLRWLTSLLKQWVETHLDNFLKRCIILGEQSHGLKIISKAPCSLSHVCTKWKLDKNSSICLSRNWRYFIQISALVHALLFFIFCIFQFYRLLFTLLYLTGNNPKQGDIRAGHGEGGVGGGAGRRDIQWACCLSNLWGPQSFAQPSVLMSFMFCRVEVVFFSIDLWSLQRCKKLEILEIYLCYSFSWC